MLATHFNVTIFPWPKSDLNRSDVYSLAEAGKTKAGLKAFLLLLPHDLVSEPEHRRVKGLLSPQAHVDDRVLDQLIGGNLSEG